MLLNIICNFLFIFLCASLILFYCYSFEAHRKRTNELLPHSVVHAVVWRTSYNTCCLEEIEKLYCRFYIGHNTLVYLLLYKMTTMLLIYRIFEFIFYYFIRMLYERFSVSNLLHYEISQSLAKEKNKWWEYNP